MKVRDLGSHNGTYLNGEQVDKEAVIKAGDYIEVGSLKFVFQIDGQPETAVQSDPATRSLPRQSTPIDDSAIEDFETFTAELDNLDLSDLDEAGSA